MQTQWWAKIAKHERLHFVWFLLWKIQEQARWICDDRSQNSGHLGWWWGYGLEIDKGIWGAGNILYIHLDGGHNGIYIYIYTLVKLYFTINYTSKRHYITEMSTG